MWSGCAPRCGIACSSRGKTWYSHHTTRSIAVRRWSEFWKSRWRIWKRFARASPCIKYFEGEEMMSERGGIVVLDFGGQYTQLIARRIREQQVFSAILPCTASVEQIQKYEPAGVVLSGGPNSVYDAGAPPCDTAVLSLGVPVLGICYGLQWMTHVLGGHVERADRREYGRTELVVKNGSALFAGLPQRLRIWNSHGDHVRSLPTGFHVTGETGNAVSAAEDPARKLYAVQFHPEVRHTDCGSEILRNFVFAIWHTWPLCSGPPLIAETVESIRKQVREARAICALSGGVDSAVAAVMVHQAIGDRLTNVFVDTGLLRKNEFRETLELLRDRMGLKVEGVDAAQRFLDPLKGVTDPEAKRQRLGGAFIAGVVQHGRQRASGPNQPAVL